MNINCNVTREDVGEVIFHIIEDNKYDKKEFLKECGISHMVKKLTVEHLIDICKYKGYTLTIQIPADTLSVDYHLENQDTEVQDVLDEELLDEFKKDEDEDDSFPF